MGLYRQPDHTEAGQHSGQLPLHPFHVTLPDGMAGGRTKDDYTECTGNGQQQFLVGKVYTLDFGVDFGFFDNRFNGTSTGIAATPKGCWHPVWTYRG